MSQAPHPHDALHKAIAQRQAWFDARADRLGLPHQPAATWDAAAQQAFLAHMVSIAAADGISRAVQGPGRVTRV